MAVQETSDFWSGTGGAIVGGALAAGGGFLAGAVLQWFQARGEGKRAVRAVYHELRSNIVKVRTRERGGPHVLVRYAAFDSSLPRLIAALGAPEVDRVAIAYSNLLVYEGVAAKETLSAEERSALGTVIAICRIATDVLRRRGFSDQEYRSMEAQRKADKRIEPHWV